MMDNDKDLFNTLCSLASLSLLAAASRTILSEDKRCFTCFLRGLVLAFFVGTLAGMFIQQYTFSMPVQGAIIGVASFIADDILMMILKVSKAVSQKPAIIIDWILRR